MQRKILGICVALVAFGAVSVLAATGSAATLTDTVGGVTQNPAAGAKIIAQSTGTLLTKEGYTAECNENVLTGTVHRNDSGTVEITIEDAWFQSNLFPEDPTTSCKSPSFGSKVMVSTNLTSNTTGSKTHWCVKTIANTDSWELEPHNCTGTGGEFGFGFTVGSVLFCGFRRTANITGTFNTSPTHAAVAELKMTGQPSFQTVTGPSHSGLCPASLSWANLNLDLYTDSNTTPATGAHPYPVNTIAPLYFS